LPQDTESFFFHKQQLAACPARPKRQKNATV
jgi:hypothetical protein